MKNFIIKELRVVGRNKVDAVVNFTSGLNIVSGPSNTGKTYIFQLIKYLLGSNSVPPQDIDESVGYEVGFLEVKIGQHTYCFERSLIGGDIKAYQASIADVFSEKNTTFSLLKTNSNSKKSISSFIFERIGLPDAEIILSTEKGQKGILRLSDFRRILMLDETKIISEVSSLISGDFAKKTREVTILNYILTGTDYKHVILSNNEGEKSTAQTKISFLEDSIKEDLLKAERLKGQLDGYTSNHKKVGSELSETLEKISSIRKILEDTFMQKSKKTSTLQKIKSKLIASQELLARFNLLSKQYEVDSSRLESLLKVHEVFSDLKTVACPFCGEELTKAKNHSHQDTFDLTSHRQAISAELIKIKNLQKDLGQSILDIKNEIDTLNLNIAEIENDLINSKQKIDEAEDTLNSFNKNFEELRLANNLITKIEFIQERITFQNDKLEKIKSGLKEIKKLKGKNKILDLNDLALKTYTDLATIYFKKLSFHNDNIVIFDKDAVDIKISGKAKRSFGKGYRGIANSITTLTLFDLKKNKDIIPEFLILDSPLTTFQGERKSEGKKMIVSKEMQNNFFQLLLDSANDVQIIIFENELPDTEIIDKVCYTEFTKNNSSGRYGFFPLA